MRQELLSAALPHSSPPAGGGPVAGAYCATKVTGRGRRRRRCPAAALSEGTHSDANEAIRILCWSDRSGGPVLTLRGWAAACRQGQWRRLRPAWPPIPRGDQVTPRQFATE